MSTTTTYNVIGTRPVRHDGADKVTGRALYGADLQLARMVHGAILRSPHAHARILRIDTSKAEALPGVFAVVTAADFPPAPADKIVDFGEGANGFLHISDLHPKYFPGAKREGGERTEKVGRKIPRRSRPMMQEALKRGQTAFELLDSNDSPLSDDSLCVIPSGSYVWVKPVCRTAEMRVSVSERASERGERGTE